jgi:hypothetical protein
MGQEGNIENYRYYADKIFGSNPAITNGDRTLSLFPNEDPNRLNKESTESDHEMVYGTFNIPVETIDSMEPDKPITITVTDEYHGKRNNNDTNFRGGRRRTKKRRGKKTKKDKNKRYLAKRSKRRQKR